MNKLEQLFKAKPRGLFMAHMIAGYPNMAKSEKVAEALVKGGADIIELQIPFSDPMADGPTIAVACEDALKAGATVAGALELLGKVAKLLPAQASGKPVPLAVMSYVNPVFRFGIPKFVETISKLGASALIVPDCPFDTDEGRALLEACKENDVFLIPVVSPGVPIERLRAIAPYSRGFVYCTSRQGITGTRGTFAGDLKKFTDTVRGVFDVPVAVGFGVKSRRDLLLFEKCADIVVAGSIFVENVRHVQETIRQLLHH